MSNPVFRAQGGLFRDACRTVFGSSTEYREADIEALLLLADRGLAACSGHPAFGRVGELAASLAKVGTSWSEGGNPTPAACELLENHVERWLKAILWLAKPEAFLRLERGDADTGRRRFNLFGTVVELDLLTRREANLKVEEAGQIADGVRRYVFLAKEDRNKVHDPSDVPMEVRARLVPEALTVLLAPIHKHRVALRSTLANLIVRPMRLSPAAEIVLKTIRSERGGHLERFGGRHSWLERIHAELEDLRERGAYLLLTAPEGTGKSALCSKLSSEFVSTEQSLGSPALEVSRLAPWLPGSLLHLGKWARDSAEVVEILLAQADAMLLTQVAPRLAIEDDPESGAGLGSMGLEHAHKQRALRHARAVYAALDRLVEETGRAVLVVDALDEISEDGSGLGFLPQRLPPGSCALLTSRPSPSLMRWVKDNLEVRHLHLDDLSREEIPLLTHVADDPGTAGCFFNDRVFERSRGWPLIVSTVAREVQPGADLSKIEIGSLDTVHERQASRWQAPQARSLLDPLNEALLLLAVFEPCDALGLACLQDYLSHKGHDMTLARVRQLLAPVGEQVEGLDAGRVKLALKAFGDYARETYCSPRDLRRAIEGIVDWLVASREAGADVLASFLSFWADPRRAVDTETMRAVAVLLDDLTTRGDDSSELLTQVAMRLYRRNETSPSIQPLLRRAAEAGHPHAMHVLGKMLFSGLGGCERDSQAARRWLYQAAQVGEAPAMAELGFRLLEGVELERDTGEGVRWLRAAAVGGHWPAMLSLGEGLLTAGLLGVTLLPSFPGEGEVWLRKAAEANIEVGGAALGFHLVQGMGIPKAPAEGEEWLRRGAEMNAPFAMMQLGEILLDGTGVPRRPEEGERWLRKAAEATPLAMMLLGGRLLSGKGLPMDSVEGEMWLRRASADRLSQRDGLGNEPVFGERLLGMGVRSILAGLKDEKYHWPRKDEGNGPTLIEFSERFLRQAADNGNPEAAFALATSLGKGDGSTPDPDEEARWLRKAADTGLDIAMWELARRLLEGDRLPKDPKEGERWLRKAADSGLQVAMWNLGERLLEGDGLPRGSKEGARWLRKAADLGLQPAMRSLGVRLLDGHGLPRESQEGERWLRKAADMGSDTAMEALGARLLRGQGLSRDPTEGESWLRKAARAGRINAHIVLGQSLYFAGRWREAAELFLAVCDRSTSAANNLGYMVRRGEVPGDLNVSRASRLLEPLLEAGDNFVVANYALALAGGEGEGDQPDWERADRALARLREKDVSGVLDYWHGLSNQGEGEGHLLVGWLIRHGLAKDPDGLTVAERVSRASRAGWNVPAWFLDPPGREQPKSSRLER